MEILTDPRVLAGLLALVAGLLLYAVLVPRNLDSFSPAVKGGKETGAVRLASKIGQELYASLPASGSRKRATHPRLQALIVRSGNPWGMTSDELYFFQFVTGFLGFVIGTAVWFGLTFVQVALPAWLVIPGATILGFLVPTLSYSDQAKKRDLDFKRQLPEALDLIIISLSGGNTFTQAVREALPNMQEGVLKEEFRDIVSSIDTGRSLNDALTHFGERAPNESIRTFVTAVREANELNVPLVEVLQSRAEASRQEFFALIHNKTAQLSSKMMGVLTPTLIPALLIIVLTPAVASLLNTMGG